MPRNTAVSALLSQLARVSTRPRYAFMLLTLIAEAAQDSDSAGPYLKRDGGVMLLRDWLCDALTPMGGRAPRRQALAQKVWAELAQAGLLPKDPAAATAMVEDEVRDRVRASGKCNLSRAVTELVSAGLLRRHYQGYHVDHANRGAQRHAVYTLTGAARCLLRQQTAPSPGTTMPPKAYPRQGDLFAA